MSSGANLLMAVMATCSVAVGGLKAIFYIYTNSSKPPEVCIFEVRKFGLCFCVSIRILES